MKSTCLATKTLPLRNENKPTFFILFTTIHDKIILFHFLVTLKQI